MDNKQTMARDAGNSPAHIKGTDKSTKPVDGDDAIGIDRNETPNNGGSGAPDSVSATSTRTIAPPHTFPTMEDSNNIIERNGFVLDIGIDQAHIGLMGQISRPGAYHVEGPNINISDDTTSNNDNATNNDTSSDMNGGGDEEEPHFPILEATPVCPIEATIIPLYEGIIVDDDGENRSDESSKNDEIVSHGRNRTQVLEDVVMKAAKTEGSSHSHQLHLDNMKLYGRDDEMKILMTKLLELKKSKEDGNINMNTLPELVLISGVSGTGKSALVMEGVREPSETMGMKFVGGKFDLNNSSMPLSAFVDAMVSLTNSIIESDRGYKIQHDINETFREEEILLLAKTLPGCEVGLFPMQREEIYSKRASQSGGKAVRDNEARLQYETMALMGKSAITCLHNKIRRLLQIICTHLQGVVLFIDDLQVSKNFVNTYTKYFARIMF